MTLQELKNSILQLAIQGKLVEQRPEEGTAEELYRQIQEEKRRLIQEGKIKKEKPLSEISEDELPFEIPESWKWVKLGNVASVLGGKRIPAGRTLSTENTGYRYIRVSDMKNGSVLTDRLLYVPQDIYPSISRYVIYKEDIYITVAGTIGRVGKIPAEIDGANLTENADRLVFSIIDQDWLIKCLETPYVQSQITDVTTKVGQPKLAIKRIQELIFPLPPIDEQKRIVAKIEELLPYIDRYEQAWTRLEELNKRFPSDLQKSILQWAIQGKLVEQRPEEGTAEELYRRIQEEKQRLVKEGTIKKEKPLPEIAEAEVPFEVPESWKWVRLSQISVLENGDRSSKYPVERDYVDFGIPFFGAKDMNGFAMSFDNVRYISEEKFSELGNGKLKDKDFVCLLRGSVGKCAVFTADEQHKTGFICAQMVIIRSVNPAVCNYLQIYLSSPCYFQYIESKITGTAVRQLPAKELGGVLIPLPPFSEQKRIVAKLEELLPLCEQLK